MLQYILQVKTSTFSFDCFGQELVNLVAVFPTFAATGTMNDDADAAPDVKGRNPADGTARNQSNLEYGTVEPAPAWDAHSHSHNSLQKEMPIDLHNSEFNSPFSDSIQHQLSKRKGQYKLRQDNFVSQTANPADTILISKFRAFQVYSGPSVQIPLVERFESNVKKATQYLLQTYITVDPSYSYQPLSNPRRCLTKQAEPGPIHAYDNAECDYILYVNDILGSQEGHQL
jgi:hypothetical protein